MLNITLKLPTGQSWALAFPTDLSEVDLSDFCDTIEHIEAHDQLLEDARQGNENLLSAKFQFPYLTIASKAVAAFCGCKELDKLMSIPAGDYHDHLNQYFSVSSPAELDVDGMEANMYMLFRQVTKAMASYEFQVTDKDQRVSYGGKQFVLRQIDKNQITGKEMPSDITTQEAIEILDFQRKLDKEKDTVANKLFTKLTYQIAVLCRQSDEELPDNEAEFERWVEARQIFFTGEGERPAIDAKTALDIDFFFGGQLGLVSRMVPVLISGIPQAQLLPETLKKWRNNLTKLSKTTKKSYAAQGTDICITD